MTEHKDSVAEKKARIIVKNIPKDASLEELLLAFKPIGEL